jgi:hypothetical protein
MLAFRPTPFKNHPNALRSYLTIAFQPVLYKLDFYVLCAATLKVLLVSLAKHSAVRVSKVRVSI